MARESVVRASIALPKKPHSGTIAHMETDIFAEIVILNPMV
jgi:hypothetical protein